MNWKEFIAEESKKEYFINLTRLIQEDAKNHIIYPPHRDIFNAFKFCPITKVKAVILGQDPYINPNQAHGLSFSVPVREDIPPSLRNIFKELKNDINADPPNHGCLIGWARQGVLLLNSSLTVRKGQANSHKDFGWTTFTDNAIRLLNNQDRPIVYLLWGALARSKQSLVINQWHHTITSAHPSPLSAHNGFFGSRPFSRANDFLTKNGAEPIDWRHSLDNF